MAAAGEGPGWATERRAARARRCWREALEIEDFGNARFVRTLFEQAYANMAARVTADDKIDPGELGLMIVADLPGADVPPGGHSRQIGFRPIGQAADADAAAEGGPCVELPRIALRRRRRRSHRVGAAGGRAARRRVPERRDGRLPRDRCLDRRPVRPVPLEHGRRAVGARTRTSTARSPSRSTCSRAR